MAREFNPNIEIENIIKFITERLIMKNKEAYEVLAE